MSSSETKIPGLVDYTLLGRSGLRVSPLCFGTMTFGTDWGWGGDESVARELFNAYIDGGGNFVDAADGYTNGHSEEMLGAPITSTSTGSTRGTWSLRWRRLSKHSITSCARARSATPGSRMCPRGMSRAHRHSPSSVDSSCRPSKTPAILPSTKFSERNWEIVDELVAVSRDIGRPPAQVALNWVTTQPGVSSTIIGATKPPRAVPDDDQRASSSTVSVRPGVMLTRNS